MQVKKQLDDELEHLNESFNRLRGAQAKFGECMISISTGVKKQKEGKSQSFDIEELTMQS